jgi:isoquinoline 1-oxidoreductase beta subunit
MSRIGTIARRTFLIGSAAIVGGVAFGTYYARKDMENPLQPTQGASLNPYVLINQDGVTLIAPRAEMGQGIQSTLAAMVAEELDVDMDAINVLHGPPAQAYYNHVMGGLGLPVADYATTSMQENMKNAMGYLGKVFSLQITGGSTSTIDGFEKMRMAGASAREALKQAAADKLTQDVTTLKTENGQVIAPDGTTLSYEELAEAAAAITPTEPTLRDPSQWRYLGKDTPRVDMTSKVTGTAEFGIDVRQPGMKFATVRMNPNRGAAMVSYDATDAENMAGVEKIIPLEGGIAVIATNTWLAFQAAEAVNIEWAAADYPQTTDALLTEIKAAFDTEPNSAFRDDGDVAATIEGATELTAEYEVPWLAHSTMEPMNATALYTADSLTMWCGNQAPIVVQQKCAAAVGLEDDAVTVHTTFMGGGFGRRGEYDFSVLAAQVAKELPDTPVQVTWSREEDMRHDFMRPAAVARFKGAVKDGKLVQMHGKIAAPALAAQAAIRLTGMAPPGPDKAHMEGAFDQPYGIDNYKMEGYLADISVPQGFWRSVGSSFNGFFHETFMDELAHAASADPLTFRKDLIAGTHAPSAKVLETVAEMSKWTGQTPQGIGRGVAFTYSFGTPVAEVIEIADEDGAIRIKNAWIACDVGMAMDPRNVRAQMMGGLVYGLSAAVMGEITFADGQVEQGNFPDYDALRMHTTPNIEVQVLENNKHMGGAGEPGTPPSMPALANAIFDLTGKRPTRLPLNKDFDFVT